MRDAFRLLPEGSHLACRKRLADTILPRVCAEIERKVADTLGGAPYDRAALETPVLLPSLTETAVAGIVTTGATITNDGFTNVRRQPLQNIILVAPAGALFIDAENTMGKYKVCRFVRPHQPLDEQQATTDA